MDRFLDIGTNHQASPARTKGLDNRRIKQVTTGEKGLMFHIFFQVSFLDRQFGEQKQGGELG